MPKNDKLEIILDDARAILKKVDFSWLEDKTILVTGATGLLGTHFLATLYLLKTYGVSIKVFGLCHSEPADYTQKIAERGKIILTDHHWAARGADAIIHAAGYAQPMKFVKSPAETIRINTALTQELLDTMNPMGKFLFVSSSEIYSGGLLQDASIFKEKDSGRSSPIYHARACYIEGKRCGEAIVNAYRESDVDAKSVRLGLTYGPGTRENDQRAMSGFIKQALKDRHIEMLYSGREPRNFCYVSDAVETMWQVLLHGKQAVYNVGSHEISSMADIVYHIAELTNSAFITLPPSGKPTGSGDVRMNIDRAAEEFGKKEYVHLKEGLRRTIDWNRGFYGGI